MPKTKEQKRAEAKDRLRNSEFSRSKAYRKGTKTREQWESWLAKHWASL